MDAKLPRIRCAICNKPVDEVVLLRCEADCGTTILVRCHGDRDQMFLGDHILATAGRDFHAQIMSQEGVAFGTGRLEANP